MKKLILLMSILIPLGTYSQDITGTWNGVLEIQGVSLRIVFHVKETNGKYVTKLDSPDQGAKDLPTSSTTYENGELKILAKDLNMEYSGKPAQDGKSINGTFQQNGMSFPMKLSRKAIEKKAMNRPQEPKTFPYKRENVKFANSDGGHHLAGTLTIPENGKFDHVVVLVSGSGPQDRDEYLVGMEHRPFLVLSDHLTRHGIAVLRYDDRGVAESEGDFKSATTADFASDALAAVTYLRSREDTKGKKIGIAGHSEGGMIAPMVAAKDPNLDYIALLAGPGIPIKDLMILQTQMIAKASGVPANISAVNTNALSAAYAYMNEHKEQNDEDLNKGLYNLFSKAFDEFPESMQNEIGDKDKFLKDEVKTLMDPWFRYFITFDPADYLKQVKCPVLAINGELDLQVTAKENLEGIEKSLQMAGNSALTVQSIAQQNHLFQIAKTGAPSEYATIEETFNGETMNIISNWIKAR